MKILVVDDHALVRANLCQVLQGLKPPETTEVIEAAGCQRAFLLAASHPDLDLVAGLPPAGHERAGGHCSCLASNILSCRW